MSAVLEPLTIEQGATWSTGWAVTAGETVESLAPIDATWTATAQVREAKSTTSVKLHDFAAVVDGAGNVILSVPAGVSSAWLWSSGYYDVDVVNAAGTVRLRVAQGTVAVDAAVTV